MARDKKSSGGGPSDERVANGEKLGDAPAAAPSVMSKYGGVIVPFVVFGLIALAVLVDMLMS